MGVAPEEAFRRPAGVILGWAGGGAGERHDTLAAAAFFHRRVLVSLWVQRGGVSCLCVYRRKHDGVPLDTADLQEKLADPISHCLFALRHVPAALLLPAMVLRRTPPQPGPGVGHRWRLWRSMPCTTATSMTCTLLSCEGMVLAAVEGGWLWWLLERIFSRGLVVLW